MRFDWFRFCKQYHINFVTSGPNTARGNISIKCPWCGESDPSEHLGLSLIVKDPAWGCLRNPQHRGRDPRRLVQHLLQCGYQQALSIVKEYDTAVPDDFDTLLNTTTKRAAPALEELSFPKEFRNFNSTPSPRYAKQFLDYVAQDRGFGADAPTVCAQYELMYALTGEQAWRIIIPIHDEEGKLRNWTGRALSKNTELRYRNAVNTGKGLLFNENRVRRTTRVRILFVVEGPWDCMKVDFYGHAFQCVSVAILGTAITTEQLARVALLGSITDQIVILMDPEAFNINMLIESSLSGVSNTPVVLGQIPAGVEDPGALTQKQVEALCNKYCTVG